VAPCVASATFVATDMSMSRWVWLRPLLFVLAGAGTVSYTRPRYHSAQPATLLTQTPACATTQSAVGVPAGVFSGTRVLSPDVVAKYVGAADSHGNIHGFVLFWRGVAAGWRSSSLKSGDSFSPKLGAMEFRDGRRDSGSVTWKVAEKVYAFAFDFESDSVHFQGQRFSLSDGNLFLIPEVDGAAGPGRVSIAGCISLATQQDIFARAIGSVPAVAKFVNP
jgi:hypothetical protein